MAALMQPLQVATCMRRSSLLADADADAGATSCSMQHEQHSRLSAVHHAPSDKNTLLRICHASIAAPPVLS